jgi:hypothetical protein
MEQITRHSRKRKSSPPAVIYGRSPWRKIEQELAAFFKSEGTEIETGDGNVYFHVVAKDSPAADLTKRQVVRVRAKDILLISLTELAQLLAEVVR